MPKERMVTRTVKCTLVNAKCANASTMTVEDIPVTIPGSYKDEKKLLKAVHNALDTDAIQVISISSAEKTYTLYGMTEAEFISQAKILPDRKTH